MSKARSAIHGVLVNVFGVGVLIIGESGTGKTDLALELIERGHKLVADDVVEIECADERVIGQAPERFAGLLAVNGVGIVSIREIFGSDAFQEKSPIDVCVELRDDAVDPLIPEAIFSLNGVDIPRFIFSPKGDRNLRLLIETVAQLFDRHGVIAARVIASHDALVLSAGRD